jgi:hypothetical protein
VSAVVRVVTKLTLLLVALAAATALMIGALTVLASTSPADAASPLGQDPAAAVQQATEAAKATEAPAEEPSVPTATPGVALIFAGIVLMAALPPIHRVHVYHRPYHRSDWL